MKHHGKEREEEEKARKNKMKHHREEREEEEKAWKKKMKEASWRGERAGREG
jgi:hypothetical protein